VVFGKKNKTGKNLYPNLPKKIQVVNPEHTVFPFVYMSFFCPAFFCQPNFMSDCPKLCLVDKKGWKLRNIITHTM